MKVIPPVSITDAGTFSRASVATYYNADGILCTAAIDEPRLNYNPADLNVAPELLIEDAATNLFTYSEQFDNAIWIKNAASIVANAAVAPNLETVADKLVESTGTGLHRLMRTVVINVEQTVYSGLFVKAAGRYAFILFLFDQATTKYIQAIVDLNAGTITVGHNGGSGEVGSLLVLPDGWFFVDFRGIPGIGAASDWQLRLSNDNGLTQSYTGDGVSGIYIFGASISETETSYIKTEAATVTRAADISTRQLVSNVPEVAPAAWSGATTYAVDNLSSVAGAAGLITVYRSIQGANLNNAPASSPLHWVELGETYQEYSGAATYALTDRVIDASGHLAYESLAAGNAGNALTDVAKWLELGPTNKMAMFDTLRNTVTAGPTPLVVALTPGSRIDAIAAIGLEATSIQVVMRDAGEIVYAATEDLNLRYVENWYDYCFETFSTRPSFAAFDLPPFAGATTVVVIENSNGPVECGALVIGLQEDIGRVKYSAESDVLNFSTVTRDFDGGTSAIVQRRNVPRTLQEIWLDKSKVNRVRALRDSLSATPAVWAGLDDAGDDYFEALLILGFYKRFSINLAYPAHAVISLELEEI